MPDLLLEDVLPLRLSDSVGVILRTTDDQYLLQHRSTEPGLYFPGFWGLFGGGMKPDEQPHEAAKRELQEELSLAVTPLEFVMRFEFDLVPMGLKKVDRWFFLGHISESDMKNIRLNEGTDVKAFSPKDALTQLRLVYYDAFAIWCLESRSRLIRA